MSLFFLPLSLSGRRLYIDYIDSRLKYCLKGRLNSSMIFNKAHMEPSPREGERKEIYKAREKMLTKILTSNIYIYMTLMRIVSNQYTSYFTILSRAHDNRSI